MSSVPKAWLEPVEVFGPPGSCAVPIEIAARGYMRIATLNYDYMVDWNYPSYYLDTSKGVVMVDETEVPLGTLVFVEAPE